MLRRLIYKVFRSDVARCLDSEQIKTPTSDVHRNHSKLDMSTGIAHQSRKKMPWLRCLSTCRVLNGCGGRQMWAFWFVLNLNSAQRLIEILYILNDVAYYQIAFCRAKRQVDKWRRLIFCCIDADCTDHGPVRQTHRIHIIIADYAQI
jgi:hypothetical protein